MKCMLESVALFFRITLRLYRIPVARRHRDVVSLGTGRSSVPVLCKYFGRWVARIPPSNDGNPYSRRTPLIVVTHKAHMPIKHDSVVYAYRLTNDLFWSVSLERLPPFPSASADKEK